MQQTADPPEDPINHLQLAIGYKLDQYSIESVTNIGDFRTIYYAWDNLNERNVHIHEYFPKSLAIRQDDRVSVTSKNKDRFTDYEFGLSEFLLEARIISQIKSAYLPHIVEYREANGTGYLISEYDDGHSLREILDDTQTQLSEEELNELLKAGLQGLRELHARNLLHTSVSPTNLFVRSYGHPLLLGQGLARYRLAQYTKTYTVFLEPGYTPLEQYGLDGELGPWCDLYSLGASLYECVARVRPIDASTRHTALIKGLEDPLTPAVELGKGQYSNLLLTNIDWMLKPYIEDRPDSADLMLGLVNFQKQANKDQVESKTFLSEDHDNNDISTVIESNIKNDLDEDLPLVGQDVKQENDQIPIENYYPKKTNSGKLVYWALGLAFITFVSVAGFQIYQHEIKSQPSELASIPNSNQGSLSDSTSDSDILKLDTNIEEQSLLYQNSNESVEDESISREDDDERREFYENLAKEEEVKRLVEEELKAREVQLEAEQMALQEVQNEEISQLLDKAVIAKEKLNLLKPQGNSAFTYYSEVLKLEPENSQAVSGIEEIADNFFSFAIKAIEENDPDKAGQHLKDLIIVRPDDPRLDGFLQQIIDLKAQIQLDEEIKHLSSTLNQSEPTIESPQEPENEATESNLPDITKLNETNTVESTAKTEPVEENTVDQAVTNEIKKIDRIQLTTSYNIYDKGRYSNKLFNTLLSAAKQDEGRAQYIIAEMYAAGRGVNQNFAESTYWLKRSLDHVNQNAKFRQPWAEKAMGVIYEKGWYVDSDPSRAVRWYRSSANKGYGPAQYRLGLAYAKGSGIKKDRIQADFWLKKALTNGHQEASKALAKLSGGSVTTKVN